MQPQMLTPFSILPPPPPAPAPRSPAPQSAGLHPHPRRAPLPEENGHLQPAVPPRAAPDPQQLQRGGAAASADGDHATEHVPRPQHSQGVMGGGV